MNPYWGWTRAKSTANRLCSWQESCYLSVIGQGKSANIWLAERGIEMHLRSWCLVLLLISLCGCALQVRGKEVPDAKRYLRLQKLIHRLGSEDFRPTGGESMYPFTYVFRKVRGGEVIRQGEGFVLIRGWQWCLVRRWLDKNTGDPGQRMLIVDRRKRKFEAEVRQWPEGNPKQRWNHWTCIRFPDPEIGRQDLYHWEYYYPEGTEIVVQRSEESNLHRGFAWYENGLLAEITRFTNSFVKYQYEGVKVKRIEYGARKTVSTVVEFRYED